MRYLPFVLFLAFLASCGNDPVADKVVATVLDWEGEYRTVGGVSQFTVCETGKTYPVVGDPKLIESVNISYNNFIAQPESPIKAWIQATPSSKDIYNTGLEDSVLVLQKLLHMTVDQFCPTRTSKEAAGHYSTVIEDSQHKSRKLDFDLFENGTAIMYTDFGNGRLPAEEQGQWGKNSDNEMILEWPRREREMRFSLLNGVLTSKMYHPDDLKLVLERTGDVVYPSGRMIGVIELLKVAAAPYRDTSTLVIEPHTKIFDLIPDSLGLAPIYDGLSSQYGVDRAKLSERVMIFENAEDVLNFVRFSVH